MDIETQVYLRDIIVDELNNTYCNKRHVRTGKGLPTKYQSDYHYSMAHHILDKLENGYTYSWGIRHWNKQELTNYIWFCYPGGTTAAGCADRIIERAGLTFKEDVRY